MSLGELLPTTRLTATPFARRYALRMVRVVADVRRHVDRRHRGDRRRSVSLPRFVRRGETGTFGG